MSELKNSDTPASPTLYMDQSNGSGELYSDNEGLTKREHFAGLAMQSMLQSFNPFEQGDFDSSDFYLTAKLSVGLADALLKELESKEK